MKIGGYLFLILLFFFPAKLFSQIKIKKNPVLVKIMNDNNNYDKRTSFGGLSGIEYSGFENIYYVVADKPPFRIYTLKIDIGKTIDYKITDTLIFPELEFEAEGIRLIDSLSYYFISDERNTSTSIYKFFDGSMHRIETIPSLNKTMRYNSGYEAIAISVDKNSLYFAFERPLRRDKRKKCNSGRKPYISIFEYDIKNDKIINEFGYTLINPSKDNGVSDILTLNDSILLVLERAWTNNRSMVSVNVVNLKTADNILDVKCKIPSETKFLIPEVLLDFRNIEEKFTCYKSYNFEGITIAHTGRHILFITDNNFSPNQTTYLIGLEIEL